jgi:hypothetical protein
MHGTKNDLVALHGAVTSRGYVSVHFNIDQPFGGVVLKVISDVKRSLFSRIFRLSSDERQS